MNAHDPNPPCGGSISGDGARAELKARVPVITLITKSDMPPLMSKRISLDDDGKLKSDGSECRMVTGVAQRVCVETASDLARVIESCRSHQAIALGAVKEEFPDPSP